MNLKVRSIGDKVFKTYTFHSPRTAEALIQKLKERPGLSLMVSGKGYQYEIITTQKKAIYYDYK